MGSSSWGFWSSAVDPGRVVSRSEAEALAGQSESPSEEPGGDDQATQWPATRAGRLVLLC
jgi:hypothetical protein